MKLLVYVYHYLYVELYLMNIKRWGENEDQNFRTNVMLLFALFMNIYTLFFVCELFSFHVIKIVIGVPKNVILGTVLSLGLFQYLYFSHNGRYKKILENFDFSLKRKNPKYYYAGTIYAAGSAFMLIIMVWVSYIFKN